MFSFRHFDWKMENIWKSRKNVLRAYLFTLDVHTTFDIHLTLAFYRPSDVKLSRPIKE
jgi:hypothetical protein